MTATGDFSKDFREEPDTADYTNPNFNFNLDGAQIESGLLSPRWVSSPEWPDPQGRHVAFESLLTYNTAKRAIVEKNSPSTSPGESGPTLTNNDGEGYELKIIYNELRIFKLVNFERTTALGFQLNFEYPANTNFGLDIDAENNLTAYADDVLLPFEPLQDSTYAAASLRPGWHSDRNESGGGYESGIYSFAALGVLSPYTIDSLPTYIYVGGTEPIETTGMGDLTTSTTVGGKAIASANAPDGDGTITLAGFEDGQSYPFSGPVDVIARDAEKETAPYSGYLLGMQGWQYVNVSNMSTSPWSLGKAVSGDTVISQVHVIDDGIGGLNEDLTLTNWALGEYVAWMHEDNGIIHRLEFTVTETGLNIGAGFVQFVQFSGFIQ